MRGILGIRRDFGNPFPSLEPPLPSTRFRHVAIVPKSLTPTVGFSSGFLAVHRSGRRKFDRLIVGGFTTMFGP